MSDERTIPDDVFEALISVLMDLAGYDIEEHLRAGIRSGLPDGMGHGAEPIPVAQELAADWNRVVEWANCRDLRMDWDALFAEEKEQAEHDGIAFPSAEEIERSRHSA